MPDGSFMEDRRQVCSVHDKTCETLFELKTDVAVTKNEVLNLSKRINGAMDGIRDHMENGVKWRTVIAGASITVGIAIAGGIYGYGLLNHQVKANSENISKVENMILKIADMAHSKCMEDLK